MNLCHVHSSHTRPCRRLLVVEKIPKRGRMLILHALVRLSSLWTRGEGASVQSLGVLAPSLAPRLDLKPFRVGPLLARLKNAPEGLVHLLHLLHPLSIACPFPAPQTRPSHSTCDNPPPSLRHSSITPSLSLAIHFRSLHTLLNHLTPKALTVVIPAVLKRLVLALCAELLPYDSSIGPRSRLDHTQPRLYQTTWTCN